MVLGRRLQDLREKAGLSYEQVAHSLDVTHATVRRMEKAEVGLKIPYVEKLLGMYEISAEEISSFLALAHCCGQ
jgi:transcriptional regulator with XRE-family HTH domain